MALLKAAWNAVKNRDGVLFDDVKEAVSEKIWDGVKSGVKTTAKTTYNVGKTAVTGAVKGTVASAPYVGSAAKGVGKALWNGAEFIHSTFDPMRPVKAVGKTAFNLSGKFVKKDPVRYHFNEFTGKTTRKGGGYKLTGLGVGVMGSFATAGSAMDGLESTTATAMGTVSSGMLTATPDFAPREYSFVNNGGATGDLAFALHNNRKG